jgi:hypothetical protein
VDTVSAVTEAAPAAARRFRLPGPESLTWVVIAGIVFTVAELWFVSPRTGLSWDETVYVSQVSSHAPAAWFDPARARGVPLLVAPVTLLTDSIVALRVYLSVLSGVALTLTLLVWRRGRPGWVLGLAAVVFGGLWVAQYYGPQAMPDVWSAFGSLAAVGFFVRWTQEPTRKDEIGLAACLAFVTLMRPGDAAYLAVPLTAGALAVRAWRDWRPLAAIAAGLVAGGAEWVAEAIVRFGSVTARLHEAAAEQDGFGFHLGAVVDELKALNGPTLCRPCTVGFRQPELDVWWLVLPVLAVLGIIAARGPIRSRWYQRDRMGAGAGAGARACGLTVACGAALAGQYLFMIDYAAPRFLLPAYAVLSIPVADGIAWLITRTKAETGPAIVALITCFLFAQVAAQHLVLDHEAGGTVIFHDDYQVIAGSFGKMGVHPPCTVSGVQYIPIAYVAGCASTGNMGTPVLVLAYGHHPPAYARHWRERHIRGTKVLNVTLLTP